MDDLISRQAVQEMIDRIGDMYPYRQIGNRDSYSQYNEAWTDAINQVDAELSSLPSAQPTPCDVCRHNPPSAMDGKPCCMCPAERREG